MNKLENKIHESEWDNLIVLDAARFDFFETFFKCYPNLEHGELEKVKSPGSATPEVLPELFPGRYDWTVFSANPFLNDRGVEAGESSWSSEDHFTDIREIWSKRGSDERGVVMPEALTGEVIEQDWDGKMVAWYIQPHMPHVGKVSTSMARNIPDHYVDEDGKIDRTLAKLIRESYKYNLLRALFTVSDLAGVLEGKTVITADHGELLFDDGKKETYRHPPGSSREELRIVPWLEIDSDKAIAHSGISDEEFLCLAYRTVLERDIEDEGLENYMSKLQSTMSRRGVVETLIHSDEYRENIGDPDRICDIQP